MRTHIAPVAIGLATLTLGFAASTPALAQECGKVQIADMTWASASLWRISMPLFWKTAMAAIRNWYRAIPCRLSRP